MTRFREYWTQKIPRWVQMQLKPKMKTHRKQRKVEGEETTIWSMMSDIPTCPATCPKTCPATWPRTLTRWDWACWPTGCCTAATGSSSWTSSSPPGGAGRPVCDVCAGLDYHYPYSLGCDFPWTFPPNIFWYPQQSTPLALRSSWF